ncbi:bacteriorhodopsin [Kineococcus sp. SYSU DK002]|uniref:bacteriorhodopsin n=1 Tax=Kineococcus sp. SYSU DK002 TaxID=3383123 RepID=UPI003D7EECA6
MFVAEVTRPEAFALSPGQHDLILYSMVVAGLALLAHFLRTWNSTDEVGARYRPAVLASLSLTGVAFLAYVHLVVKFDQGYVYAEGTYLPNAEALNTLIPRYMDWSVTVPLLMVEFLAVSALAGARARSTRFALMAAAFLMIFTGFLGAAVDGGGDDQTELLVWGVISTVFYIVLHVLMIGVLRSSRSAMGAEAYASYRNATILLLSVWAWYPVAYAIHNWLPGANWTTTIQVGFGFADIAAKVGFGALIHKVAKLRTAEDVHAGEQTHPEEVWISSVKKSEGVQPVLKGVLPVHDGTPGGAHTVDVTSTERATAVQIPPEHPRHA